jgi:predicted Rossmann fold flavoprotein
MEMRKGEGPFFDIAVIGGGAAGSMAAIRASSLGKKVCLLERNESIGRKVLLTGKGRCNLTNTAGMDAFVKSFGRQGEFLRTAFHAFSNDDLVAFLEAGGLATKVERQGRVFPATDSARSVVDFLERSMRANGVEIICGFRVRDIKKDADRFRITPHEGASMEAAKIIIATGGGSYKSTGSTGDGFDIAERLGHKIAPLSAGLVPLTAEETWVRGLQGVALENIRITFSSGKKKLVSDIGELMFTHFGVSGPLVLDMSARVLAMLEGSGGVKLSIDLKPGLSAEGLERRMLRDFAAKGKAVFRNVLKGYLPKRMVDIFVELSGIPPGTHANQVTQAGRKALLKLFKGFPLTITGSLPIEEAMVTGGGVSTKDIDPRTMESRAVPGLYFAGEVIDGAAASGGYNLQQAFSTGYLAGEKAAGAAG